MQVLIVEDNPDSAALLEQALREAGYRPTVAANGDEGLQLACASAWDLILLDIMLPDRDGLSVCRALRKSGARTPVLMLTARDTTEDKVAGLDSGADDYLVKPFRMAELYARMRAVLRRADRPNESGAILTLADLSLRVGAREASRSGKMIYLSGTEFRLLEHLMRHQGRVLARSELMQHVWQYDFGGNDGVLDVYISYLRAKVDRGHAIPLIHTVRGVGYRLSAAPPAATE